jgi:hypothetical protein
MRIVIVQTSIVIDLPDEETTPQPSKPIQPLTLLEKVLKAAETEREAIPTRKTEGFYHGKFLTQ